MCICIYIIYIYIYHIYIYKLYIGLLLLFCEISPWLQHFEGKKCHGCHGLEMLDTDASCNAWGPQQIQRAWCPGTTNPLRPRSLCPERPRLSRLQRELLGGFNLPLWKIMEFVSWDYDISNWMESHSKFHGSSHHQPGISGWSGPIGAPPEPCSGVCRPQCRYDFPTRPVSWKPEGRMVGTRNIRKWGDLGIIFSKRPWILKVSLENWHTVY